MNPCSLEHIFCTVVKPVPPNCLPASYIQASSIHLCFPTPHASLATPATSPPIAATHTSSSQKYALPGAIHLAHRSALDTPPLSSCAHPAQHSVCRLAASFAPLAPPALQRLPGRIPRQKDSVLRALGNNVRYLKEPRSAYSSDSRYQRTIDLRTRLAFWR